MPNPELVVPIFCPICDTMMKGQRSTYSYYNYGCCVGCEIYFLEGRPDAIARWKSGWRPSAEELRRKSEAFND
jgi:hypothetical protein